MQVINPDVLCKSPFLREGAKVIDGVRCCCGCVTLVRRRDHHSNGLRQRPRNGSVASEPVSKLDPGGGSLS